MNKTIIFSVLGLGILLYVFWFLQSNNEVIETVETEQTYVPATENTATAPTVTAETFVSPHTGEMIEVTFAGDTATLANDEYDALVLRQVVAASGARYEDTATGVVLWNKGAEVSLYKDDVVTFQGQTEASMGNPNPGAVDVRTNALTAHPWIWEKTEMNDDTIIVPKKPGAFVLTFDTEGRVGGATDCNGFGGDYTATGNTLNMGPFMMTQMYCEGSQEMEFQKMLSEPVTFMFTDAGELVLMLPYDSGSVIFTPKI